jgi:hypothetical protein
MRSKRQTPDSDDSILKNNLFVEILVVVDSTVYNYFQDLFSNLGDSILSDYIKLYFCHIINGVIKINFILIIMFVF